MILKTLEAALAEALQEQVAVGEVVAQLRSMIAKLSGLRQANPAPVLPSAPVSGERSHIDDIIDVLRAEGKPLHITVICDRLSISNGSPIERTKIEPGLNRHISKVKIPRIWKSAPSTYGLPEWKTRHQSAVA